MREIFIGAAGEKYAKNEKKFICSDEMVKIDDRTATSIMRSWCIIRADVEIHVTDRIEKHEVTDLFIYLYH